GGELLGLAVQLAVKKHNRRPRALGQHRAVDLLADQLALVLVVVGQLVERLGHGYSRWSRRGRTSSVCLNAVRSAARLDSRPTARRGWGRLGAGRIRREPPPAS